ncbi:MAG: S41 family peptidase [Xanthomarina sp.]
MKYLNFWLLLLILFFQSCASVKKHNEIVISLHSIEALQTDVDAVYKQLQKYHPRLYQYISKTELDFKFDSLKTSITQPLTSHDFFEKLAPVLAEVRQGHISVTPPQIMFTKKERKDLIKKKFEFYDLEFRYLDKRLWVSGSKSDSLLIGSEVIKINDEITADLVNKYQTQYVSDGFNTTFQDRYLGLRFHSLYARDKGFLDSLSVTFKQQDSLFIKTFRRISKDSTANKVDSLKQKTDSIKVVKPTKAEKLAKKQKAKDLYLKNKIYGFEGSEGKYTRNFNFVNADSTVAIIKIRGFSNGQFKKFYKQTFKILDSLKTPHLILDLRDNGGGRLEEIAFLYRYLAKDEFQFINRSEVNTRLPVMTTIMSKGNPLAFKLVSAIFSPVIVTSSLLKTKKIDKKLYYKFKYAKKQSPFENRFNGKLYVLINGYSFSASSILSAHIQANNLATFIGEETGGAYNGTVAGMMKTYTLPNSQVNTRIGLMQIETPYKVEPDGFGVKPDVYIVPNIEQILSEQDPEVEWILNYITN